MRRLSRAGLVSVCAAFALAFSGCGSQDRGGERVADEPARSGGPAVEPGVPPAPGSELMAQEAPPAVGRPITGEGLGPRMDPNETAGRWPFYWTRAIYTGGRRGWYGGRGRSWSTDYPKGDIQFLIVLKRLVRLNAYDWENAVSLMDPDIRRFPVIYAVEVGRMNLTDEEVEGLRTYLDAGGFLIVDDFWGEYEWRQFMWNMARVFPNRRVQELPMDHELFSTFYEIDEILQVPNIGNARRGWTTSECGPCQPFVGGIFDDDGRLMVVVNWNTDLGDAWEWAESPDYPLEYSTFAYEMGANMIVYGLSH